jgi:hypothetical protein
MIRRTFLVLSLPCSSGAAWSPRVLCARDGDGLTGVAPDTEVATVFTQFAWQVVTSLGQGGHAMHHLWKAC